MNEFPYYPTRYFRRQVANWLIDNRQRVLLHKESYLRQTYGIPDEEAQFPTPFSYKQYCRNVLDCHFWGDAVILYAVSCMWALKLTVIDSQTLQQYRVWYTVSTTPLHYPAIQTPFSPGSMNLLPPSSDEGTA